MYKKVINYEKEKEDIKSKEIAEYLDIDKSNLGNYLKENKIMPLEYLVKVCNFLKISLDYVFEITSENTYKNDIKDLDKVYIGTKLKDFRKDKKISQEVLARILKDKRTNIAGYESGKYLIPTDVLYKICTKYNLSTDYFLLKK